MPRLRATSARAERTGAYVGGELLTVARAADHRTGESLGDGHRKCEALCGDAVFDLLEIDLLRACPQRHKNRIVRVEHFRPATIVLRLARVARWSALVNRRGTRLDQETLDRELEKPIRALDEGALRSEAPECGYGAKLAAKEASRFLARGGGAEDSEPWPTRGRPRPESSSRNFRRRRSGASPARGARKRPK